MSDEVQFSLAEYRAQREADTVPVVEEVKAVAAEAKPEAIETEESASEEDKAAEVETEKPKKGDRLQKRFDQLTSKIKDLEAKLAEKPAEVKPEVTKPVTADKPKIENFDSLEDFQEALTDWKLDQREKQAETKRAEESAKSEHNKRASSFKSKIEAAQSKYDDFDEVVLENPVQPTKAMVEAMLDSDLGAEIAYHLGQNTDEIKRISGLSPARQAVEIGRIEAKLEPVAEEKKSTPKPKAPAPLKPLGGKGEPALKPIGEMTLAEYRAARNAGKIK